MSVIDRYLSLKHHGMKNVEWLWRNSACARWYIVANIFLCSVSIGLNLFFIWLSKSLVDVATITHDRQHLVMCGILLFLSVILRVLVNALKAHVESISFYRTVFNMRQHLFDGLLKSQWTGKDSHHSGDTISRVFTDAETVASVVCQDFPALVSSMLQLIAAFIFLSMLDLRLAVVIIAVAPFFFALSKIFFRRMRKLSRQIRDTESVVQSHIQESLQHKTVVQSMLQGDAVGDRLDRLQSEEMGTVRKRTGFSIFSSSAVSAAFGIGYSIALLWGVFGIYSGTVTFGILTAFLQLVGQIQGPSMRIARQISSFVNAIVAADRLMEIDGGEKEDEGSQILVEAPAGISIDNLTFRYPDGDRFIFNAFSHDFVPGSRTAVIGETGAGKSTLIRLMLSLLKPVSGTVRIYSGCGEGKKDGIEVSALTRTNFIYVPQGNTLFSGSLRENLLMGNPDATEQMLWDALDVAAADFVRELPEGLDTVCGEFGTGLSEGQAQRIAVARGLLRSGSILLLDEFSSSLDNETEERLLRNLSSSAVGKTIIFITHRDNVVKYCDNVLEIR